MRTSRMVLVVLVGLGCGTSSKKTSPEATPDSPANEAPPVADPGQTAPQGKPKATAPARMTVNVDGRQMAIALRLEANRFMVSEPIFAFVELSGDPGVEAELSWMGRNQLGRPENYAARLIDADGKGLTVPDAGPQFGGQTWPIEVEKPSARQQLFVPNWFSSIAPGHYLFEAKTTIRARKTKASHGRT